MWASKAQSSAPQQQQPRSGYGTAVGRRAPGGPQGRAPVRRMQQPQRPQQNRQQQPTQQMQRAPQKMQPQQVQRAPPPVAMPPKWKPEDILVPGELFCKVRKITSGDTLFLEYAFPDRTRKSIHFQLRLDYVKAPGICRNQKKQLDEEPYGWEAREYLRELLIGAVVRVKYNVARGQPNHDSDINNLLPTEQDGDRPRIVYGSVQCLQGNAKQAFNEEVYKNEANWVGVAGLLIREGVCDVNRFRQCEENFEWQRLNEFRNEAASQKKGIHGYDGQNANAHLRQVEFVGYDDLEKLYDQLKNQPMSGIVEDVREGSTVRVEIRLPNDSVIETRIFWLNLSGIQCERVPKPPTIQKREWQNRQNGSNFVLEKPSPLATAAKQFVERRLLHQNVTITIRLFDHANRKLYGTVDFMKRDIASHLLKKGLAKTQPYTLPQDQRALYSQAEQIAQQSGQGMWRGQKSDPARQGQRKAKEKWRVTQVTNADCIVLINGQDKTMRTYLAHIKAQRLGNNFNKQDPELADHAWEAKEFVRKELIGKDVDVDVIYTLQGQARKGDKGPQELPFVSIKYDNGKDISEGLIARGFAKILSSSSTDKAANYGTLLELERTAIAEGKVGIHQRGNYKAPRFDDLTLPGGARGRNDPKIQHKIQTIQKKAYALMSDLSLSENILRQDRAFRDRQRKENKARPKSVHLPCVVEYVFNSTRMKVRLVNQKKYIIFLLSGVQGNRNKDENSERLAREATQYVTKLVQQQDNVFVEIETLDRNNNFAGYLHVKTPDRVHVNQTLLQKGFAKVFAPSAEKSRYAHRFFTAETEARDERIGLWHGWVERQREENSNPRGGNNFRREEDIKPSKHPMEGQQRESRVTHIESATEFCVNFVDEKGAAKLQKVQKYTQGINPSTHPIQDGFQLKQYAYVAGLFSDGNYHRCQIKGVRKKGGEKYSVVFLDFGNKQHLDRAELLPLERFTKDGNLDPAWIAVNPDPNAAGGVPPLAVKCTLAGLKQPPEKNESYCRSATEALSNTLYFDCPLSLDIKKVSDLGHDVSNLQVVAVTKDGGLNVNENMVARGWCRVNVKDYNIVGGGRKKLECPFPKYLASLNELQTSAQKNHIGMYMYGMVDSDDEQD